MIRIALADDHEIFRDGLKAVLAAQPDFEVCADASNGKELIEKVRICRPEIILIDIMMPEMDGITACAQISKEFPEVGIIALTMGRMEGYVVKMLEAGAMGYIVKHASRAEVIESIRSVHSGQAYFCNNSAYTMLGMLSQNPVSQTQACTATPEFSDVDQAIIKLLCEQRTNKEIAGELHLSIRTVEWHRTQIQEKMEVRNVVGLALYAIRNGLYTLPQDNFF